MNPVDISPTYFSTIHSNNIHPSAPRSSKWSLTSGLSTKIVYAQLISPMRATRPTHLILLDLMTLISGEEYKLREFLKEVDIYALINENYSAYENVRFVLLVAVGNTHC